MAKPTDELVPLKVKVSKELRKRLKVLAAETGISMNDLVIEAITQLLKRRGAL